MRNLGRTSEVRTRNDDQGASSKLDDIERILRMVVADGYLFDEHERYALSTMCGFARVGGRMMGIQANQLVLLEEDSPYAAAATWCDS